VLLYSGKIAFKRVFLHIHDIIVRENRVTPSPVYTHYILIIIIIIIIRTRVDGIRKFLFGVASRIVFGLDVRAKPEMFNINPPPPGNIDSRGGGDGRRSSECLQVCT